MKTTSKSCEDTFEMKYLAGEIRWIQMEDDKAENEVLEFARRLEDRYFEERRRVQEMVFRRMMPDQDDSHLSRTMDNFEKQGCPPEPNWWGGGCWY